MALKAPFILFLGYFIILLQTNTVSIQGIEMHDAEVRLKTDLFKNYSKEVLPPHHGKEPVTIHLGLAIISISDVDPQRQSLTTQVWLKLKWEDSRMKWDADAYNNLRVIRLSGHQVWQPDIKLYNSAKLPEMDPSSSNVYCLLYADGSVVWIPPATFVSHCQFDLKYYPYDSHECFYKFGSWTFDGYHIHVDLYNNETGADLTDSWNNDGEWEIISSKAITKITKYSCCEEPYPDATFYITIQRRSPFYKVAILCPLLAAIVLILISFWISPVVYEKITLNVVAFFTLILILLHLANKLPAVGGNVPLIMSFCASLLLLSTIVIATNVCFRCFITSRSEQQIPHWVTILLDSWLTKLFCISPLNAFESITSSDDPTTIVGDEDSKGNSISTTRNRNHWISLFQLIDRVLFVVFLIIIGSMFLAAAT